MIFIIRNIRSISLLDTFSNLNCLSIDGNYLQDLRFLKNNFALAELYAGNNHISNIKGSFGQLKNLRILHLQNNQISNLNNLAYELRHLSALEDLSKLIKF
jgi:Leucine-rich repeat (LRR) protein